MLYPKKLDIRPVRNLGELAELWPVFLELEEEVPTDPVRVHTVTCAGAAACSPPPRHGGSGTDESTGR